MRKRMKKWEVAHTMQRRRRRRRKRRGKAERKPKRTPNPCGNMSQGRQELEGVEPPNLVAPIVKRPTLVHILV